MNGHEEISSIKKDVTYNSSLEIVDYFPNTELTFLVITFLFLFQLNFITSLNSKYLSMTALKSAQN